MCTSHRKVCTTKYRAVATTSRQSERRVRYKFEFRFVLVKAENHYDKCFLAISCTFHKFGMYSKSGAYVVRVHVNKNDGSNQRAR